MTAAGKMTKLQLYEEVEVLRRQYGVTPPVDAEALARYVCDNLTVETLPFESTAICGILVREPGATSIALNAARSPAERNFDCAHELFHYILHPGPGFMLCRNEPRLTSFRSDYRPVDAAEYQANEAAAELLMPYREFLPLVAGAFREWEGIAVPGQKARVARHFGVTPAMVAVRLEALAYELMQVLDGVPPARVSVMSAAAQRKRGILPPVYTLY